MKIKTYCKEIDLDDFMQLQFEPEECMITFIGLQCTEKLYFPSRKDGFEFYFEIIEGLYSESKEVDLNHIQVSYGHVDINSMKDIIRDRLKYHKPDEE